MNHITGFEQLFLQPVSYDSGFMLSSSLLYIYLVSTVAYIIICVHKCRINSNSLFWNHGKIEFSVILNIYCDIFTFSLYSGNFHSELFPPLGGVNEEYINMCDYLNLKLPWKQCICTRSALQWVFTSLISVIMCLYSNNRLFISSQCVTPFVSLGVCFNLTRVQLEFVGAVWTWQLFS